MKSFLGNAAVLALGGMVAKGIGALYRIPLTALLGGYGMGLYQMAYPLFCVLLTFSSAGIPSAFSRLLAGERAAGRSGRGETAAALRLFSLFGLLGAAAMALLAPVMSDLQGEKALLPCYLALAPAVLLVAPIAVLRGYFQGKKEMAPTALSEICEQLFKAGLGLFFALRYPEDPARAVFFSLLAVTLSELAALLYLWRRYKGEPFCPSLKRPSSANILFSTLPVMASAALLPLSQMADSVVLVRLLSRYSERAVTLYGLYAGGAMSLINLPASVCYGLSAASVPAVATCTAKKDEEGARARSLSSLCLTFLFSLPCAVGLFLFAKPAVSLLYPTLPREDATSLISLVKLMSVSAATLSGVNTLSACLTGMGKAKCSVKSMLLAVFVKLVLQLVLVSEPSLSVYGAGIAANACYLVAFFLDLFYTVRKKEVDYDRGDRLGSRAGGPVAEGGGVPSEGGRRPRAHKTHSVRTDA